MKKIVKKCAICGKQFKAKAVNQSYCSAKCKRVADKNRKAKARKAVAKKPVACKDKVVLPKKPTKVAKAPAKKIVHREIHVRSGDVIVFDKNFAPIDLVHLGMDLVSRTIKQFVEETKKAK